MVTWLPYPNLEKHGKTTVVSITCTWGLADICSEGLSIDVRLEQNRNPTQNIKTPFCNAPVRLLPLHSCLVCFVEKLMLKSFYFNNICKLLRRALVSSVQFIFLNEISSPTSLHLVICPGLCDWSMFWIPLRTTMIANL